MLACNKIAERSAELIQYTGAQQKVLKGLRLRAQHFTDEVVQDEPVIACKAHEMVFNFLLVLVISQRQGQQAQPGRPSLQVAIELRKRLSCQAQCQCLPEKVIRFCGCEAQSGRMYYEEFSPGAPAREWQRWRTT